MQPGIRVLPRPEVEITFITLTATSRENLLALVDKYKRPESIARAFQMALDLELNWNFVIWVSIHPRLIAFRSSPAI